MPEKLPIIDTAPRDMFFGLFEPHFAGSLTEVFLECGPRAGIVMPADIMGAVIYHLRARTSTTSDPTVQEEWREILLILAENWEIAEAFADYCVHYQALPEPFRLALHRQEKSGGILAKMNHYPAS